MIINNTLRLAHLPFLMRDWRNQFVKKKVGVVAMLDEYTIIINDGKLFIGI